MNSRPFIFIAVILVVLVGGAVYYLQSTPGSQPPPVAVNVATPSPSSPPPAENLATPAPFPATPAPVASATPAPAAPMPEPIPEWENRISDILSSKADETQTAQSLINILPSLPNEGKAEAAQHITNLITDKEYNRVLPLLRNPYLPEEVQDVLVTDLMNREDSVKLPALLDVARIPNHPYHEEALTDLQIFLDADNGSDWGKWDDAVKQYLKKQAAANPPAE